MVHIFAVFFQNQSVTFLNTSCKLFRYQDPSTRSPFQRSLCDCMCAHTTGCKGGQMYVQGWVAVQISLKGRLTSVHVNFASAFCKICRALRSVMHAVPWARNATNCGRGVARQKGKFTFMLHVCVNKKIGSSCRMLLNSIKYMQVHGEVICFQENYPLLLSPYYDRFLNSHSILLLECRVDAL